MHDVGALAARAHEQPGVLDHRHGDLAVAGALEDLLARARSRARRMAIRLRQPVVGAAGRLVARHLPPGGPDGVEERVRARARRRAWSGRSGPESTGASSGHVVVAGRGSTSSSTAPRPAREVGAARREPAEDHVADEQHHLVGVRVGDLEHQAGRASDPARGWRRTSSPASSRIARRPCSCTSASYDSKWPKPGRQPVVQVQKDVRLAAN